MNKDTDKVDFAALKQKLFDAKYSYDPNEMCEALQECHLMLMLAEQHACKAGTRQERAERVFDFLGFDEIAAQGHTKTGGAICCYILYRMQKDGRDKPTQTYYDTIANKIHRDERTVRKYWSANQARFARPLSMKFSGIPDPEAYLLEQIRLCFKQEGQRLVKK